MCALGPSGSEPTLLNILGGIDKADSGLFYNRGKIKSKTLMINSLQYRRKHLDIYSVVQLLVPEFEL